MRNNFDLFIEIFEATNVNVDMLCVAMSSLITSEPIHSFS
jgi:hypothetical protein